MLALVVKAMLWLCWGTCFNPGGHVWDDKIQIFLSAWDTPQSADKQ